MRHHICPPCSLQTLAGVMLPLKSSERIGGLAGASALYYRVGRPGKANVPHSKASCRMRATEVARAAPQKLYQAISNVLMGTFARAVTTVITAGAQTMFCTCMACKAPVAVEVSHALMKHLVNKTPAKVW